MRSGGVRSLIVGAAIAQLIGGCSSSYFTALCLVPVGGTDQQRADALAACIAGGHEKILDTRVHNNVDILFVIDNSPSMSPKQKALAAAIPQFISALDATRANYHLGVVTTDLGTYAAADTPFPGVAHSACSSYEGDDGVLQNIPCTNRSGLTGEAAAACAASCPDPRFVPAYGARYIAKQEGLTNVPQHLLGGVDLGPQQAFQCLALVGDTGCQITQPLEAARRALDNHRSDNAGFNRANSLLAVLFITDQDDCSVPLLQRQLLNPATPGAGLPKCESGSKTVDGQCFNAGFRCIAKDLVCAQAMNTPGAKTGCQEDPNTFLTPIDQYVDFFASLPNPDLVIAGIWSPTLLDNLAALPPPAQGGLYVDYDPAAPHNSAGLDRGTQTQAACYNPDPSLTSNPQGFFGQAQLRLSTFLRRFQKSNRIEQSICDPPSYPSALSIVTNSLGNWGGYNCLTSVPKTVAGTPQCLVGYIDASQQRGTPDVALPVCSATCCNFFATDFDPGAINDSHLSPNLHREAGVAACGAEPADCYCAVASQVNCTGGAVPGIWRKGNAAPPEGKIVSFRCAY